jgi:hypothetical protein
MTPKFLGRFFLMFAVVLAANSAWAGTASPVASLGGNTYSITVKANNKFTRNTDKLKDEAVAAATEFCTKAGKQLKVVSVAEDKSLLLVGPYAQVALTFKALGPDDPELAAPADAPVKPAVTAPLTTDELYASLMKLDDLRKKGLLTDAEFDAEKKKLLARSK